MAITELQLRQGTENERLLITPLQGELLYTTDTKRIYVGDGVTPGGSIPRVAMPPSGTADNTDRPASTSFVQQAISNITGTNLSDFARKTTPNLFTALNEFSQHPTVTASTLPIGENSPRVATTQWVQTLITSLGVGSSTTYARRDQGNTFTAANEFTISPQVPSPAINDSSNRVPTTSWVRSLINTIAGGGTTISISPGVGTQLNYSGGTATLPNGQLVTINPGVINLPTNGTYYVFVDSNGSVNYSTTYPTSTAQRVIAVVSLVSGNVTNINTTGVDLSGFARLDSAAFTGPVTVPSPPSNSNDNTVASTSWVNTRLANLSGLNASNIVTKDASNIYLANTTQDLSATLSVLVPLASISDDSNRAASTAWVRDYISSGSINLHDIQLTGDPKTPTPAINDNDTSIANTSWVRQAINQYSAAAISVPLNGPAFPQVYITSGLRVNVSPGTVVKPDNSVCTVTTLANDIAIDANSTVYVWVRFNDCSVIATTTEPLSSQGTILALITTNATAVTSLTLMPNALIETYLTRHYKVAFGGRLVYTP
jgi:hypothetical protein